MRPGVLAGSSHRCERLPGTLAALAEARAVIRELGLDCQLVRNRGELMILPAGVTKGCSRLVIDGEGHITGRRVDSQ
jgi:hypothetical protein